MVIVREMLYRIRVIYYEEKSVCVTPKTQNAARKHGREVSIQEDSGTHGNSEGGFHPVLFVVSKSEVLHPLVMTAGSCQWKMLVMSRPWWNYKHFHLCIYSDSVVQR